MNVQENTGKASDSRGTDLVTQGLFPSSWKSAPGCKISPGKKQGGTDPARRDRHVIYRARLQEDDATIFRT